MSGTSPAVLIADGLATWVARAAFDAAPHPQEHETDCGQCDDMRGAGAVPYFLVEYLARRGYEIRPLPTVPDSLSELADQR